MKRRRHQNSNDSSRKRRYRAGVREENYILGGSSNEATISQRQESEEYASQSNVKGQSSPSTDMCAPLLRIGGLKNEDALILESPSIHLKIKPSTIVSNPNYVLAPFFHRGISGFAEILADETGHNGQFVVARKVALALLDSMGFECNVVGTHKLSPVLNKDLHQVTVKSFSRERRPAYTATSTRDFALLQIAVYQKCKKSRGKHEFSNHNMNYIMNEIALAYRIATHFALSYKSKKIEKSIGLRKRALMTIIVSLRGLLSRLVEQLNGGEHSDSNIEAFFLSKDPNYFSDAEHLLIDIVPLLTCMSADLGSLGEKKTVSLAHNLLKLDYNIKDMKEGKKREKSELHSKEKRRTAMEKNDGQRQHKIILRDGLVELFFRQLLRQEYKCNKSSHVSKELTKLQSRYGAVNAGAIASLLPSLTKTCSVTIKKINTFYEAFSIQKEGQQAITVKKSSEFYVHDEEDSNLLRLDGCIYLSKLMKLMALVKEVPHKVQTSAECTTTYKEKINHPDFSSKYESTRMNEDVANCKQEEDLSYDGKKSEHDLIDCKLKICQRAFFLFHTLMENDPSPTSMSNVKSVKRRENLMSAVFASIVLAGKMCDTPVRTSTLQKIVEKIHFPDLSFMVGVYFQSFAGKIDECAKSLLKEKSVCGGSQKTDPCLRDSHGWGRDSRSLTREYELHLLSFFGFSSPPESIDDPLSFLPEIARKLSLDASSIHSTSKVLNDSAVTFSSLCLLGDPKLIAIAAYYLGCIRTKRSLTPNWEKILGEKEVTIKIMSTHMWQVMKYTKQRNEDLILLRKLCLEYYSQQQLESGCKTSDCPSIVNNKNVSIHQQDACIQLQTKVLELLSRSPIPDDLSTVVEGINMIDVS